ncbi:chaperone modulator CbpM [Armatimonas sp.]|uniref:chaperone modulator CbpM n=1 Tax=Armatimonas sp. TaxID=1872638 RepID=UPI00375288C7
MRRNDEPLYTISIAARLVRIEKPEEPAIHPQTLRMYERLGLVTPMRVGKNRLYSEKDIERVRQIQRLTQEMGVNLAGVEVILGLLEQLEELQAQIERLRKQVPPPSGG